MPTCSECQLDVQSWNYSVITSKCKGPRYPANKCCDAFKELACPYSDDLNDVTNNCIITMFSYINRYGKYPIGLFANLCRDSRRGLECTQAQKSNYTSSTRRTSSATNPKYYHSILLISYSFVLLLVLGYIKE